VKVAGSLAVAWVALAVAGEAVPPGVAPAAASYPAHEWVAAVRADVVPLPSGLILFGTGLAVLAVIGRRRRR
jgi:hypothetical protein